MGSDGKLLPLPLSAGIDQSMDEFAAPPGTVRRSINTRVRQGGGLEQRRGVHGFAVTTPSYMANFQATGAVEFSGSIGNMPAFGMAGNAYVHDRRPQFAYYAGEYSQYEPLSRETAILSERQHGLEGCRHVVFGKDERGRHYTVMASMSATDVECRVMNQDGHTIASFTIDAAGMNGIELIASQREPYAFLVVDPIGGSGQEFSRVYKIHLADQVSYTERSLGIAGAAQWNAQPITSGVGGFSTIEWGLIRHVLESQVRLRTQSTDSTVNEITIPVPSMTLQLARAGFASSRDPESTLVVAYAHATGAVATGALRFVAISQADLTPVTVVATGTLIQGATRGYSAPIITPTDDPQRFLWIACNGITSFGDLVIPSGPARSRTLATMAGVPLSLADSKGAHWSMLTGEFPALGKAGRAVLVSHPGAVPSCADYSKPVVQLAADRQFPVPEDRGFVWSPLQWKYSRIAERSGDMSVMLPLRLRSQGSGLYSMERYTYRHSASAESGRQALPVKGTTLAAGQPVKFYPSPNRVGIGVVTGAPTYAARPQLASEVGFATEPYIATLASASGVNIAPGTRLYTAIFEWLSPAGERHRSRPATPRTFVNTSNTGVAPYVPEEFLSQRFPAPRVHYYRTIDGQKQFLRVSPDTGVAPGTQFYDHASDDEIRDNEVLYTDGGVQPNDLAPSCRFMALGQDRLWLGGLFETDIIQASKKFIPREPVQFSDFDSFKVRLPFPCTGLAYLDGSLVAFCDNAIFLVTGDGPNNQGVGSFSMQPLSSNVGCIDHRSVVATSIGVFFQAKRGICLMPRGFGPPELIRNLHELMGELGDGYTEIIGTAVTEASDEETVRFLIRNPSTNQRIVATFETATMTWGYDTINDADGNPVPLSAIGHGPEGTIYGAGSGPHRFLVELEGAAGTPYDSMGSTVNRFLSEVHLGKMSVFGPAGEGKVKGINLRGFSPATGAQVRLSVVTDYGTQTHTFSGIGSGTFFRRIVPAYQDSSEMQISATFTTGVGRKQGLKLLSLTLELEGKAGARRARIGEQE